MSVKTIFVRKKVLSSPSACLCGRSRRLCVRWMQSDWVLRNDLPCRFAVGYEEFAKMQLRGKTRQQLLMWSTLVTGALVIIAGVIAAVLIIIIRYAVFGGV